MIAILDYICLGFKANIRKDAGVVERGGLEIRYTALLYPGFESLSFRIIYSLIKSELKSELI